MGQIALAVPCLLGSVASNGEVVALPYGLIRQDALETSAGKEIADIWQSRVQRGDFTGVGGVRLAYAKALVGGERATVVIVNGRTENLLKYQEVVADLLRQGYSVYLYDHRGQGFSERLLPAEPQKGHVEHFDDYVDDLQRFVVQVVRPDSHRKLLLLAHSMGGGIATRHLERFPGTFAAAALSSPMHQPQVLGMSDLTCPYFRWAGRLFWSESWAGFSSRPYSHGPFDDRNEYTHSPQRWARVLAAEQEHPETRLGGPTRRWVAEACDASEAMLDSVAAITTPVLVLQAGADTAVTAAGQNAFCAELARAGHVACEGGGPRKIDAARHELLIERDDFRVQAMVPILDFFARYSDPVRP